MKTGKTIEQEVNEIRLSIYEETKDMTPEQYTERVRKIGEVAAKKYGFHRVARANPDYLVVKDEKERREQE
ncbi:MAG: hypothetical protein FWF88_09290 [Peptococcaceae bacterium]|nr:hypothetical protein [Peptococcaceae bacterium]